jgi:hypothetical protein
MIPHAHAGCGGVRACLKIARERSRDRSKLLTFSFLTRSAPFAVHMCGAASVALRSSQSFTRVQTRVQVLTPAGNRAADVDELRPGPSQP